MIIRKKCDACQQDAEHVFFYADADGIYIEVIVCRVCGKDNLEIKDSSTKQVSDEDSSLKQFAKRESL